MEDGSELGRALGLFFFKLTLLLDIALGLSLLIKIVLLVVGVVSCGSLLVVIIIIIIIIIIIVVRLDYPPLLARLRLRLGICRIFAGSLALECCAE